MREGGGMRREGENTEVFPPMEKTAIAKPLKAG
jgi:hypothetical protein